MPSLTDGDKMMNPGDMPDKNKAPVGWLKRVLIMVLIIAFWFFYYSCPANLPKVP